MLSCFLGGDHGQHGLCAFALLGKGGGSRRRPPPVVAGPPPRPKRADQAHFEGGRLARQ